MGFTVTHKDKDHTSKDEQFQDYYRLLTRRLVARKLDLAAVPRSHDPATGRNWLFVWDDERDAQEFATALQQETADPDWIVAPVAAPPSVGPLRPIEIDATVRSDGYVFALAPWARTALRAKFRIRAGWGGSLSGTTRPPISGPRRGTSVRCPAKSSSC